MDLAFWESSSKPQRKKYERRIASLGLIYGCEFLSRLPFSGCASLFMLSFLSNSFEIFFEEG